MNGKNGYVQSTVDYKAEVVPRRFILQSRPHVHCLMLCKLSVSCKVMY